MTLVFLDTLFERQNSIKNCKNMQKYTIFKTKWGHFGLAGTENSLLRTHLPADEPEKVKCGLLKNLQTAQYDKNFFKALQQQIAAYFDGELVKFEPVPFAFDGLSSFTAKVLKTCGRIEFGRTVSYSVLAAKLGSPSAGRAVGNALAKNPLPLIIPCHRIIRSDGRIGGFSASGGVKLKNKLLQHEQKAIIRGV